MDLETFKKPKFLIYGIVIFFLILNYLGVTKLIVWVAGSFLIYTLIKLALENFACMTCWIKTATAASILVIALGLASTKFIAIMALLLTFDLFIGH